MSAVSGQLGFVHQKSAAAPRKASENSLFPAQLHFKTWPINTGTTPLGTVKVESWLKEAS